MLNNLSQISNPVKEEVWEWKKLKVAWNKQGSTNNQLPTVLLIHGFGACKEHWRHNQNFIAKNTNCYAIDLIGFGSSSKPRASLKDEFKDVGSFCYCFDSWGTQINDFCKEIIKDKVILIGNSIGAIVALTAAKQLEDQCKELILINCAQRTMDDKRLGEQSYWMNIIRPLLKTIVRQRWLSNSLFRNAANRTVITKVLLQAYPSGSNIDKELIKLLHSPSQKEGAAESFRGFINLFNDHLAPDLMAENNIPVHLIWGEKDPWEPIELAQKWAKSIQCIKSLEIVKEAGHCPHDERPEIVNPLLLKIIQAARYESND